MVCFGSMFIKMSHPQTKEMIEKGKAPWAWITELCGLVLFAFRCSLLT